MTTLQDAAMRKAILLCEWIAETPHQRGSINGQAAQVEYALRTALEQVQPSVAQSMVDEMDMNDRVLAAIDAESTQAVQPSGERANFEDLIGMYWDLAYAEGHSHGKESYGTKANEVLCQLRGLLAADAHKGEPVAYLSKLDFDVLRRRGRVTTTIYAMPTIASASELPLYTRAEPAQPEQINCDCGRTHKKTAYGWACNEPAQQVAVPQGWKLVPIEPTRDMEDAAGESIYGYSREKAIDWVKEDKFESAAYSGVAAYRAMLAAAPSTGEQHG